jgi:N-methylhydantoinase A
MVGEARRVLRQSGSVELATLLDLRYVGQEFSISVPVTEAQLAGGRIDEIRASFDALHEHRYAHHAADEPVEVVNIRLAVIGRRPTLHLPSLDAAGAKAGVKHRKVHLDQDRGPIDCPVYDRDALSAGTAIEGPALVQEYASTTVLFGSERCTVADTGELVIAVGRG